MAHHSYSTGAAHPTNVIPPPQDFQQHLPPPQPAPHMSGSSQSFGIHAAAYHRHSYSPGQVKREGHSPSSPRRQISMGNALVPPQSPPPHNQTAYGLELQSELGDHGQPNFRPQWSAPAPPANDGQVPLLSQRYPAPYQGNQDPFYQPPCMQRDLQSPLPCQPCQVSTVTPNGHPAHGIGPQSSVSPSPPQHPLHMDGRRQQSQASLPPPLPNHGQEPPPSSLPQQPSQSPPTKKAPSFGSPPGPPVSPQNMPTSMPHHPSQPQTHNHTHIQSPYEQSPTHNMYPTPSQGNQEYSPYGSASSRPRHRVAQACDRCRHLKAKCDEQKPCKNCKEKNKLCNYKAIKQQDKITEMLQVVTSLNTSLSDMKSLMSKFDSRLTKIKDTIMGITAAISPGAAQDFRMVQKELTGSEETASNGQQKSPNSGRGELVVSKEAEEPIAFVLDDDRDDPPGSPVPAGKPAIPENHTTGTGNLLMWPAINDLVGHLLEENGIKYPKTYPLGIEENRGLLHLYGRGEGSKKPGGKEVPNDFGLLTSTPFEDATPSLSNEWGCMGAMDTAPYSPQNIPTPEEKTPHQWGLSFERDHVWKLVQSYQDNMQNMHPIILPNDLDALITNFLENLPTVYVTKTARSPPIAGFAAKRKVVGDKRKREDTDDGSENLKAPHKRLAPPRHIKTAVVLCILALGEICLHKERIPDVVPTSAEMQSTGSFSSQPYDSQGSPGSQNSWRNMDLIPGLHYLANATDIMGNEMAGASIWHVYANILAGLYYGQLGRVTESYSQIYLACVKAQNLLRNHFSRLTGANGKEQDIKDIQYYLIYWTCMQLECDIIAELNLQQSGIGNYEQSMPHPSLQHMIECGIDERVAYSYYGQIWLRKMLNRAHTMLYGPKSERENFSLRKLVETLHENLTDQQDLWWPKHHPHEPTIPADNILDARLRAKYWGAMNIICRPVIKSILGRTYIKQEGIDMTDPLNEFVDPYNKRVLEIAQRGINALIHSTQAFHNLAEPRYIVTNSFGTAQAQWGNLITLAAIYKNEHLSRFINPLGLKYLFDKTIQFFEIISHPSSALEIDRKILVGLRESLFSDDSTRPEPLPTTSSSATNMTDFHTSTATQSSSQPTQLGPQPLPPKGHLPFPCPPTPPYQTQNEAVDFQF